MRFGDAAETAVQGNIQWEVQVVDTGLAASLNAVRIRAERLERIGIGPEEALRQVILAATEFAIPIRRKLVVRELTRISEQKRDRSEAGSRRRYIRGERVQVSASSSAELIAFEIEQIYCNRIKIGLRHTTIRRHRAQ